MKETDQIFLLHPSDLLRRRKRCKPIVEQLLALETEVASCCNICGGRQYAVISRRDRYGFPARSALCLNCGLVYVLDRFTVEGYATFYRTGTYRTLIARFKGKKQTIEHIRAAQVNYTRTIIRALDGLIVPVRQAHLLDVGGSTGLVAAEFRKHFGYQGTLLDPAPDEVEAAGKLGVNTVVGSIENWETDDRFELILLCRTIEHLFDLRGALTKIRTLLQPDGLFYCDIADFVEICRREGPPEATTKVDHCYWLTPETAPAIFRSLGFAVVSVNMILPPDQVGFLLRPCEPADLQPVSSGWIEQQARRFREMESEWMLYGRKPYDVLDWFKQKAYRVKKKLGG